MSTLQTKRLLVALLCASTLALTLVSCGSADNGGSTSDNGGTEATTTATAEITAAPEYVAPETKYDGKTFIFASWTTDSPNWVATSYSEAAQPEPNGDLINDALYERIKAAEEATGVTVESRLYKATADMRNTVMAGDHFADCILSSGPAAATLALNKVLYDLNTIDTLDLSKSWWNQTANEAFSFGDKLYIGAGDISPFCTLAAYVVYANKGLISSYNLDDPYEAVRNGEWTYDMMREMGTAVAHDVDGDGVMTKTDVFGVEGEPIGDVTVGACGVTFTGKDENGMPVLTLDPSRAALAVEKIVTLFRDKNITIYSSDYSSGYKNVFRELLVQKFIEDELLFLNNWLCVALELRTMDSDFGILPPPMLDEEQEDYRVYHSESWTYYAVVPLTIQDAAMVGHVIDALGYYGHEILYTAIIDTTITSKALRDTDTEEMLQIVYDNRVFDPATMFGWGLTSIFGNLISNNSTNFASSWAAAETQIIAKMEETAEALA